MPRSLRAFSGGFREKVTWCWLTHSPAGRGKGLAARKPPENTPHFQLNKRNPTCMSAGCLVTMTTVGSPSPPPPPPGRRVTRPPSSAWRMSHCAQCASTAERTSSRRYTAQRRYSTRANASLQTWMGAARMDGGGTDEWVRMRGVRAWGARMGAVRVRAAARRRRGSGRSEPLEGWVNPAWSTAAGRAPTRAPPHAPPRKLRAARTAAAGRPTACCPGPPRVSGRPRAAPRGRCRGRWRGAPAAGGGARLGGRAVGCEHTVQQALTAGQTRAFRRFEQGGWGAAMPALPGRNPHNQSAKHPGQNQELAACHAAAQTARTTRRWCCEQAAKSRPLPRTCCSHSGS